MIQQRPGGLLEIEFEGRFYYVVVLTRIVMLGGNVIFAFHGDGSKRASEELFPGSSGFNICTDLLLPKKEGTVRRLSVVSDASPYWRTRLAKATPEYRPGYKAQVWFIYTIDDLAREIDRVARMTPAYNEAMDRSVFSFDLVAEKILTGYMPDQNPHL